MKAAFSLLGRRRNMDSEAFDTITRNYTPLDLMVRSISSSLREASPRARLRISLDSAAGPSLEKLPCLSADRLHNLDQTLEARQAMLLLGYGHRLRPVGIHRWAAGCRGTLGETLESDPVDRSAVEFALVTHREWFKPGTMPHGLPKTESAHPGLDPHQLPHAGLLPAWRQGFEAA